VAEGLVEHCAPAQVGIVPAVGVVVVAEAVVQGPVQGEFVPQDVTQSAADAGLPEPIPRRVPARGVGGSGDVFPVVAAAGLRVAKGAQAPPGLIVPRRPGVDLGLLVEVRGQVVEGQDLLELQHGQGVLALVQVRLATFEVGGDWVRLCRV
jgi:hypothetical protein